MKCTGCGEENQNWHLISHDEVVELVQAQAHFVYKCKCCSRENYLTILPSNQLNEKNKASHHKKNLDTVYLDTDCDKFKTIISFDCRGLELTAFDPRDGWAVQSGKKTFVDVDLSEKDWCEYNDIDNVAVEISNVQYEFVTLK